MRPPSGASRWGTSSSTARPGWARRPSPPASPATWACASRSPAARALAAPKDLIPYLTNAEERSVLFIDEIHRLPKAVEEFLYPAMEDFRIDLTLGEGVNARTINMHAEALHAHRGDDADRPARRRRLRDRFQMREHLDFYTVEELAEIVRRNAGKLRVEIVDGGGRGDRRPQPRHAAAGQQPPPLGPRLRPEPGRRPDHARRGPRRPGNAGHRRLGLDPQDRKYLETIARVFGGGPVGVEAVAHTMNLAPDTLIDEVEPFLLRSELVVRTPPRPAADPGRVRAPGPQSGRGRGRPAPAFLTTIPLQGYCRSCAAC